MGWGYFMAAGLLLASGGAMASDWQRVMPPPAPAAAEFDREGIIQHGNFVRVWVRALYPKPITDVHRKLVGKILTLREIDCSNRTHRTVMEKRFRAQEDLIGSDIEVLPEHARVQPIEPDSFEDALRQGACPAS